MGDSDTDADTALRGGTASNSYTTRTPPRKKTEKDAKVPGGMGKSKHLGGKCARKYL